MNSFLAIVVMVFSGFMPAPAPEAPVKVKHGVSHEKAPLPPRVKPAGAASTAAQVLSSKPVATGKTRPAR
jgi:hypothetical protein